MVRIEFIATFALVIKTLLVMKKFSAIEKRFNNKIEKLNMDMTSALMKFVLDNGSIVFDNRMLFTKDNGEVVFIEKIYSDYISLWVRFKQGNGEVWAMDFNNTFSLREKQKLFQMISML